MNIVKKTIVAYLAAVLTVACAISFLGCEEENTQRFRGVRDKVLPGTPSVEAKEIISKKGTGLVEAPDPDAKSFPMRLPKLSETDFIAGEKHRDPFSPALEVIVRKENEVNESVQREIKLKEWDVTDLRLIGIITNISDPMAMVVTPDNEGIVLRRGDYVGKADFVDPGGNSGERIQVNWRVARIHGSGKEEERGIYLVRDDPLTQTPEDVTRFMPLHPPR